MLSNDELVSAINKFAASLSNQPLELTYHQPEEYSQHTKCFENTMAKMDKDGGRVQFGWIFSHRIPMNILNSAGYLMATHHAVWHSPEGNLVDVTPLHPDPKHHPFRPGGNILFQVDNKAEPVVIGHYLAPLPIIFFPLTKEESLVAYVKNLNKKEESDCKILYNQLLKNKVC